MTAASFRDRWENAGSGRAFIVEGGGIRGAVSLGQLLGFELASWPAPEIIYASSSGALNAAWYLAGNASEAARAYLKILTDRRIINPLRIWRVLDLDRLICDLRAEAPARLDAFDGLMATRLYVAATDAVTGEGEFFDLGAHVDRWAVLKASAALPGAYPGVVDICGRPYIDGGPYAFPLHRLRDHGSTLGIAFLTRPASYRRTAAGWGERVAAALTYRGISRPIRTRFLDYSGSYNDARDQILGERDPWIQWLPIVPPEDAPIPDRLERSPSRVADAIQSGLENSLRHLVGASDQWSPDLREKVEELRSLLQAQTT